MASGSRRKLRLEEYASSGLVAECEDADESLCRVKIRPLRQSASSHASVTRNGSGGRAMATQGPHHASSSHRQNDRYLEAFDAAYEELSAAETARGACGIAAGGESSRASLVSSSTGNKASPVRARTADIEPVHRAPEPSARYPDDTTTGLSGAWLQGPHVAEGSLHAVSAQPLMCMSMSVDESEVVVGSSDHALYVIPLGSTLSSSSGRSHAASRPKTLYTKKFGHAEWVTCVTYLPDKRIVSGGMDSKLCLWDATGVKCEDLLGHSGSVSCVLGVGGDVVLSCGYDKTLRLWNVSRRASSRQREQSVLKAGSGPILDVSLFGQDPHWAVCGDRDGGVQLVDLEANKALRKLPAAHKGHTTSVLGSQSQTEGSSAQVFFSGGQDGAVRVWDARQKAPTHSLELHVDPRSGKSGAVGFLREPAGDDNVLLTAGADGVVNVLDKRASYGILHSFTEHLDFIYSLHVRDQLCFSGAGNGMLHAHDWKQGKLLYGLGANQAAVRAITASASKLVAAGDDGGVVVYDME